MKIGILGTGDVGKALGTGFVSAGHEVRMGSRKAGNEKARAWAAGAGSKASEGDFAQAAKFGEVVVLATLGSAAEDVVRLAGPDNLGGKVLIDTTNPLEFPAGRPPQLFVGRTDSLGERVQRWAPKARVVKAFNTVGNAHMYKPDFPGGPPDMFIGGDDDEAKKTVTGILTSFGWNTVDLGGIEAARYLEPMCVAWVLHGIRSGSWNHAFKLLHR